MKCHECDTVMLLPVSGTQVRRRNPFRRPCSSNTISTFIHSPSFKTWLDPLSDTSHVYPIYHINHPITAIPNFSYISCSRSFSRKIRFRFKQIPSVICLFTSTRIYISQHRRPSPPLKPAFPCITHFPISESKRKK